MIEYRVQVPAIGWEDKSISSSQLKFVLVMSDGWRAQRVLDPESYNEHFGPGKRGDNLKRLISTGEWSPLKKDDVNPERYVSRKELKRDGDVITDVLEFSCDDNGYHYCVRYKGKDDLVVPCGSGRSLNPGSRQVPERDWTVLFGEDHRNNRVITSNSGWEFEIDVKAMYGEDAGDASRDGIIADALEQTRADAAYAAALQKRLASGRVE